MKPMTSNRKAEIRPGTFAQIGDMGWREKIGGAWDAAYPGDAARYDACAVEGFGVYVDLLGDGRVDLIGVYLSREAAERAVAHFVVTGRLP
jgi:hypothetical protein